MEIVVRSQKTVHRILDPKILDGYSVNSEKKTSSFGTGYVAYGMPIYEIFDISSRSLSESLVVSLNKKMLCAA